MGAAYTSLPRIAATALVLLGNAPATAGEVNDGPVVPVIRIELSQDGDLSYSGLPAVASDGRVAFIAGRGEYDESTRFELRIVAPGHIGRRLTLVDTRHDRPGSGPAWRRLVRSRIRQARTLLAAGGFKPLPEAQTVDPEEEGDAPPDHARCQCAPRGEPGAGGGTMRRAAGPWCLTYDDQARTLLVLDAACKPVMSRPGLIPRSWQCCEGGAEPADPGCLVGYSDFKAWAGEKAIMVEGVNIGGIDGCEIDDAYVVLWPGEGMANISWNWASMAWPRKW